MIQNTPLISVIVPVYNQERYVGRCLRSLLDQTLPQESYEIVVVNDGSTDRTSYALDLFHDGLDKAFQCIRVLTNEKNLGLPASVNRGIRAAEAPYIVRVDSDDYVNTNYLNFLHTFLEGNPDMDAVACDYLLIDDKETVIDRVNCMEHPIACGIIFRKQQLLEIGLYDESFRIFEERDLRIRFEKKYSIQRLELPLYRYRQHDNNLTGDLEAMEHHKMNLIRKHNLDNAD